MSHFNEMDYPLTLAEFREWLLSKSLEDYVGCQHSCFSCPIFHCLHQKGVEVVCVLNSYTSLNNDVRLANPTWVTEFIDSIDSLSLDYSEITAKDALGVL